MDCHGLTGAADFKPNGILDEGVADRRGAARYRDDFGADASNSHGRNGGEFCDRPRVLAYSVVPFFLRVLSPTSTGVHVNLKILLVY